MMSKPSGGVKEGYRANSTNKERGKRPWMVVVGWRRRGEMVVDDDCGGDGGWRNGGAGVNNVDEDNDNDDGMVMSELLITM